MKAEPKVPALMRKAFGWGSGMAGVRLVCSFISIKVTAVYLGPSGLALVAQFTNFISLFQGMLGTGLSTGATRLSSERVEDGTARRMVFSTALKMGAAFALVFAAIVVPASSHISSWLLTDSQYAGLIALSGIAVAAAMLTDLLNSALATTKEIGLVGRATIMSTVLGLATFAPCSYYWGVTGGLWATFAVVLMTTAITVMALHRKSSHLRLTDFLHSFDRATCYRILGFYPMLIVNGVLPPLVLILIRDNLVDVLSLDKAGIWQATWRLSEAYQALIISSITLFFMPSLGERANNQTELRRQILRTVTAAALVTAFLASGVTLFREHVVRIVFNSTFSQVADLIPMQSVGDVLKMAGWVLSMSLVSMMRTGWFIFITLFVSCTFVGLARLLITDHGINGVMFAYVAAGFAHVLIGSFALRDLLIGRSIKSKGTVDLSP
jgi:PST family polysaccharide transporter